MGKKPTIIQVSFKEDELNLYHKIILRSKLLTNSGWMKEAALEKLEREENLIFQMVGNMRCEPANNNISESIPINNIDSFLDSF